MCVCVCMRERHGQWVVDDGGGGAHTFWVMHLCKVQVSSNVHTTPGHINLYMPFLFKRQLVVVDSVCTCLQTKRNTQYLSGQ